MYEFAKINVREIFGHNRIAKINVRENYQKQDNFSEKTSAGEYSTKIFKNRNIFLK